MTARSPLRPLTAIVLLAALWGLAPPAEAEVRRCVTPTGQTIFTDRKCSDVGATQHVPQAAAAPARMYRGGCARNLQELVFEISTAIDARDANRLAGVYHWTGMSGSAGYQVWSRLDAIARRPLVDIVPVMSSMAVAPPAAPTPPTHTGYAAPTTSADAGATTVSATPTVDPKLYPQTAVRRTPVALRVEQTLGASATPARTVFGLVRHFGCWWVRL
jgi:hypothetical protein